jgi:hypothetical protein
VFASANDFNPPSAAQFGNFAWTNNSSAPFLADLPRGMSITDTTAETGVKVATRLIPDAMRANFIFTAKISYSPLYGARSGVGIAVTTGGGASTKLMLLNRWGTSQTDSYGCPMLYYSDHGNDTALTDLGAPPTSQFRWMRIQVVGNVATAFISDDGVNWVTWGAQDFGEPITEYGFGTVTTRVGIGTGLCDYFDSTELPFNRF